MALLSEIAPLGDTGRLVAEQAAELPQRDDLCGPFWGLLALRAAGIDRAPGGGVLDQDEVAHAAGTLLGPADVRSAGLPPGERPRRDHRLALPVARAADEAGTSAAGLARAIGELSGGSLAVVPARGDWTSGRLERLLDELEQLDGLVAVLANLAMGALWEPEPGARARARYLRTGADGGEDSAWAVGHFVALLGRRRGPCGTLLGVADTYRSRALHRQPVERVVRALGGSRGVLVVAAADAAPRARAAVLAAGLQPRAWDNGSGDARAGTAR